MIDVLSIYNQKIEELKQRVAKLDHQPLLVIVSDNLSDAGRSYIKSKVSACELIGIKTIVYTPEQYPFEDVDGIPIPVRNEQYKKLMETADGVIFQHPFFDYDWSMYKRLVRLNTNERTDVDGIDSNIHCPCTPRGIWKIIDHLQLERQSTFSKIILIGNGKMIGKPFVKMYNARRMKHCQLIVVDSKNSDQLDQIIANGDQDTCIVCATPVHNLINKSNFNPACTYIDCGCNKVEGKLLGNVSRELYSDDHNITPVPNGVGKMTVWGLLANVVYSAEKRPKF